MRPRLSVVIPLHNGPYGSGLVHRASVCIRALLTLADRHALRCEVMVVDWNPAEGAPRFRDLLPRPAAGSRSVVRHIEVPVAAHESVHGHHLRPFQSATARNVGVRRATGEHVLVTGADALPNDALIAFLAAGALDPGAFYRIDRRDLAGPIPLDLPVDEQLALAGSQDSTRHLYFCSVEEPAGGSPLGRLRRAVHRRVVLAEYERHRADPAYPGSRVPGVGVRTIAPADGLHRNGAGDFLLLHRDRWHELGGFTELPTRGHTDSIMCWTAASAGLRQVILEHPLRLYHQHHEREAVAGWPVTDWRPWYRRYQECRGDGTTLRENGDGWGLRDVDLPEWTVTGDAAAA